MSPENQILQATAAFANALYAMLARREGNVLFSPFSLHAVLSMLQQGAQADTQRALGLALNTPDLETAARGYRAALARLGALRQVTLLTANKLYAAGAAPAAAFARTLRDDFAGEAAELGADDAKKAAESVNDWVREKTRGNIKGVVSEEAFQGLSLLVVNAVFFKGEWASKFKEAATKAERFFVDGSESVEVKMMHQNGNYWYEEDEELGARVLELPYKGHDVKMVLVLPVENDVGRVEERLRRRGLGELGRNAKLTDVHLFLPRFRMEETLELKDVLAEMGLKGIFDAKEANFRGMFDGGVMKDNVFVSGVVQKAFIEVDEGGTVAAAATRAALVLGSAPGQPKPVTFKVDHPAIFLLLASCKEAAAPHVLFYGRLSRPQH